MTTTSAAGLPGFIGRIPVRNIWLLLLYASQLYRELPEARRVELEEAPDDIPDLVAEILANAVERRLRRNLNLGYRRRRDDLNRVRGRIDVLRTERRQLLQRGRVSCVFDELTVDTPRNRYVKAALLRLPRVVNKTELGRRCRNLAARLERAGVLGDWDSSRGGTALPAYELGWVEADERRMLAAARLVFELSLPTEQAGRSLLSIPDRQANQGWKLYENAVFGFYDAVLSHQGWKVTHGGHISWPVSNETPQLRELLPSMITDIVLERPSTRASSAGQRIVIDTKFTSIVTSGHHRDQSFKTGNIYQIYAYLRSQEDDGDPLSWDAVGVLLYPSLGEDYDEDAVIQGHQIRFATVDLAADSQTIRNQLLRIVDRPSGTQPAGAERRAVL